MGHKFLRKDRACLKGLLKDFELSNLFSITKELSEIHPVTSPPVSIFLQHPSLPHAYFEPRAR